MKASLEELLRMLPVKGSAAAVDFLDRRNEDREYIERYVAPQRERGSTFTLDPVTGELLED